MEKDDNAVEALEKILRSSGDPWGDLVSAGSRIPPIVAGRPAAATFQFVRCGLTFTQKELTEKSGLTQSQVSRLESGADALVSTWARAYSAMGFGLLLVPLASMPAEELEKAAWSGAIRGIGPAGDRGRAAAGSVRRRVRGSFH